MAAPRPSWKNPLARKSKTGIREGKHNASTGRLIQAQIAPTCGTRGRGAGWGGDTGTGHAAGRGSQSAIPSGHPTPPRPVSPRPTLPRRVALPVSLVDFSPRPAELCWLPCAIIYTSEGETGRLAPWRPRLGGSSCPTPPFRQATPATETHLKVGARGGGSRASWGRASIVGPAS